MIFETKFSQGTTCNSHMGRTVYFCYSIVRRRQAVHSVVTIDAFVPSFAVRDHIELLSGNLFIYFNHQIRMCRSGTDLTLRWVRRRP